MSFAKHAAAALFACSALVYGCGSLDVTQDTFEDDDIGKPKGPFAKEDTGSLFGAGGIFSSSDDSGGTGAQLPVNRHLWRATLDTLEFLPLTSTDPYGGVIVSDWGSSSQAPNERFKVTTYITSAVLKPQSLRVVVNKQSRTDAGDWIPAAVADDTARKLEDAILTRARQLRSAEAREEG